jgi:hypothetical protein
LTFSNVSGVLMMCDYETSFQPEMLGCNFQSNPQLSLTKFCIILKDNSTANIITNLSSHRLKQRYAVRVSKRNLRKRKDETPFQKLFY